MKKNYVLEWLDNVIAVELNPEFKDLTSVTPEQATSIRLRIAQEEVAILSSLKKRVFGLKDEQEAIVMVKKYHDALVLMITKNYDHLHHPSAQDKGIRQLHEFIGSRLHRILEIFEKEFHAFLNGKNLVPLTRLIEQRAEMYAHEMEMKEKLAEGEAGIGPVHIIMEVFLNFSEKIDARTPITVHESSYIRGLFRNILELDGQYTSITGCPALIELLIVWNVNSKTCIQYFTHGTESLMNAYETDQEKLDFLKLERKKVDNIPEKQDFILNPDFLSVKEYCGRWLKNEIEYRENKLEGFAAIDKLQEVKEQPKKEKKPAAFKVLCSLSIDQFALIMRGADEKKILIAPSLSAVYEAVTPFISTKNKGEISPKSARNKSYNAERRDKDIAKWALKEIADAIDGY